MIIKNATATKCCSYEIYQNKQLVERDSKKAFNEALASLSDLLKNEAFVERLAYSVEHC